MGGPALSGSLLWSAPRAGAIAVNANGSAASDVLKVAAGLACQARLLTAKISRFLAGIRAA